MVPQFNLELHNTNNDFLRELPTSQQTCEKSAVPAATSKQTTKELSIKKKTEQIEEQTNSNCLLGVGGVGGRRLQLVSRGTEFIPQNSLRNTNTQPKRYHSSQNQRNRLVVFCLKRFLTN